MASSFLENLKKSVEEGEFNSEAAKKIIEIDKLADEKKNAFGLVINRVEKSGFAESVSEEEAAALNSVGEKQLELLRKQDEENKLIAEKINTIDKQLTTLVEIEDMVKLSVADMFEFADELEGRFQKEFEAEDPMFGELSQKIEQIKSKYNSIINN